MDAVAQYGSDDSDEAPVMKRSRVNAAPDVPYVAPSINRLVAPQDKQLALNMPAKGLTDPMLGPANPYSTIDTLQCIGNAKRLTTGVVESTAMDLVSFDDAYHNRMQTNDRHQEDIDARKRPKRGHKSFNSLVQDKVHGDGLGSEDVDGVWVPFKTIEPTGPKLQPPELTEEQKDQIERRKERHAKAIAERDTETDFDRMVERKSSHLLPQRLQSGQEASEARSEMHDKQDEVDYQGRSWIQAPSDVKPVRDIEEHTCYLPKRTIHAYTGHTKGVQGIEFFPSTGHLLLSAGMDHMVKIWDVYKERKCKRTYYGHTGAVRDITFSNDGKRFLSCGFDRFIRLWDTETGECLNTFTTRRVPYCVKFYPKDNNQFIVGDSNNMIVQFDATSGEIVQEYNHHLQAVNSVTFVDDDRRFVSTSDDKKILIWDWNIPVPIKYISEPSMHSMPAVTLHPSGGFFAGQSMNNQIDVYTARDKIKLSRKKVFRGHSNAGYACQIGFSPNGKFLMSGDAHGRLFFWDWKTTKSFKTIKAHDRGPTMGAIWHPVEPSTVATCGWDGFVKLWA